MDGSAPTANSTELNDRRSSMVSNGELADYYRYSWFLVIIVRIFSDNIYNGVLEVDDVVDENGDDNGDEQQEGVRTQLPGKLQQSTSLTRRCQVQSVV